MINKVDRGVGSGGVGNVFFFRVGSLWSGMVFRSGRERKGDVNERG